MEALSFILYPLPFTYLISVVAAWFLVHTIGEKSGIPRAIKAEVIFYPIFLSVLKGFVPGILLSIVLSEVFGVVGPLVLVPTEVGYVVSGLLLHRKLHQSVSDKLAAHCIVGAIALIYIVGWVAIAGSLKA
ncbi:hypothetical protein [Ruegeria faecimaris]|uniref:Uncharacterized protein n=1 Tax=Ruegeria faecimaris TaxID=686389 RepID=A0A521AWU7_9RHOB|nr:hypothetical protein [Ruegeria faecimaris]SMO39307.1 hypothetical protein SAMN06265380_101389 [Ruegeria faecimaris]